jgi:hypothetical protein
LSPVSSWETRTEPGLSPWWRYNGLESIVDRTEVKEFDSMKKMKQKIEKWKRKIEGSTLLWYHIKKYKVEEKKQMEQSWIESVIVLH